MDGLDGSRTLRHRAKSINYKDFDKKGRGDVEVDGDSESDFAVPSDDDDDDEVDDRFGSAAKRRKESEDSSPLGRRMNQRKISFGSAIIEENSAKSVAKREESSFETNKDGHCVSCSRELELDSLDAYKNLYTDRTSGGKNLYEVFRVLVGVDVQQTFFGSRICDKCYRQLDNIERLYREYRSAADSFHDAFLLGQKMLDADACAAEDTSRVEMVSSYISLETLIIKVIDPTNHNAFNALAIEADFEAPVQQIYSVGVVPEKELPSDGRPNEATGPLLALKYDPNSGTLERSIVDLELTASIIDEQAVDPDLPQIYMTAAELSGLKKASSQGMTYVSLDEVDRLARRIFLGHKLSARLLLSQMVAEEYQRQIPSSTSTFCCSDCSASFDHFHMLSSHIQCSHVSSLTSQVTSMTRINIGGASALMTNSLPKTGEVATLEKPFQCEYCEKVFSDNLTLSAHVKHYHGTQRKCNVSDCEKVTNSIQEFVQHYASHADPNISVPTSFEEKKKVILPCPLCNVEIQGVWKYYYHTYTHDKEARFVCPVCSKRMHKAQNFKDHLQKHRGPVSKNKRCPFCLDEFFPSEFFQHLREAHPDEAESQKALLCHECGKSFATEAKLKHHQEMHIPRSRWTFKCSQCDSSFPSKSRRKLHVVNVHSNCKVECVLCLQSFSNKHQLQSHMKNSHSEDVIEGLA